MQFYKKKEFGKQWQKNPIIASLHILRDTIVFLLPVRQIPSFMVKFLYGVRPKFIFFIHPRRTEDIYMAFPPSVIMRRILGKNLFIKIISLFPPVVLSKIQTPQNVDGLILTSPLLPENFLKNRKKSFREAMKGLYFGSKLVKRGAVFGLGALWPMVTRRGLALIPYAKSKNVVITNGHCGTLISIFLSIKKMAILSGIPLEGLKVAILGVGKMGENLARIFYGKVATLTLIDINETRLNLVEKKLQEVISETNIQKYTNSEDFGGMRDILRNNHIAVCTTSNVRRILRTEDIPDNCIIIDDSRPEAIPRDLDGNRIILEGGLMKIEGLIQNYDFGLGIDENVFGCLAESYLLSFNFSGELTPTLGEVKFENFNKMVYFCQKLNITVGDFKCRNKIIDENKIISILKSKFYLSATIPFKNICWIFKIDRPLESKRE